MASAYTHVSTALSKVSFGEEEKNDETRLITKQNQVKIKSWFHADNTHKIFIYGFFFSAGLNW